MSGRVLVVSWNGGGNLPTATALAARLVRAGLEVAVMVGASPAVNASLERVLEAGAKLIEYQSLDPWPAGLRLEDNPRRFDDIRNGVAVAQDILFSCSELQARRLGGRLHERCRARRSRVSEAPHCSASPRALSSVRRFLGRHLCRHRRAGSNHSMQSGSSHVGLD